MENFALCAHDQADSAINTGIIAEAGLLDGGLTAGFERILLEVLVQRGKEDVPGAGNTAAHQECLGVYCGGNVGQSHAQRVGHLIHLAGGEIGHITVNRHETAVCGCGKRGCLEQYSSATGVVRCMKKLLDENPDTPCTLRGTDFAAKDVFDAARAGDALAAREVDEMTDTLGMALASIASTTDPEMFMVGGGVARAGDVLFNPLREHFKTYAFSSCRETPIVAATLGNDAGIYGAVRLIVGE